MATCPLPDGLLLRFLRRPRQCGVRSSPDEQGSSSFPWGFRLRRRPFLLVVFLVRSAEQLDPAENGGAPLDRAHHDHLGSPCRGAGAGDQPRLLLCDAVASRCRGSWVFPRRDSVPDLPVPPPIPRAYY